MAVSIMNLIRTLVSQLGQTQALACGGGGSGGSGGSHNHNIPEISNFGDIITFCKNYPFSIVVYPCYACKKNNFPRFVLLALAYQSPHFFSGV